MPKVTEEGSNAKEDKKASGTNDIVKNALSGSLWTFFSQAMRAVVILVSTVVIARYVSPKEWGIAETAKPILVFLNLFVGMGLNFAIVQRKNISDSEVNFLFWVNVGVSIGLAGLLSLSSGFLASFFAEPALEGVSYALAAGIIFNGVCAAHHGLLLRKGRYKQLSFAEFLAPIGGAVTGITLAILGYGYWAIIVNTLVTVALRSVFIIGISGWRPTVPKFEKSYWGNIVFGSQILGSTLLSYFTRNMDNLIIAKLLGTTALGFYSLAYRVMVFPFFIISEPISRVMIGSLSRLQNDEDEYLNLLSIGLSALYLLLGFMAILVGVFAEPLIIGLLGQKWDNSIVLVQILAWSIPFQALLKGPMWCMVTLGKSTDLFKWSIFVSLGTVSAFFIGAQWDIIGVSVSYSAFTVLSTPLSFLYLNRQTQLPVKQIVIGLITPTAILVSLTALSLALKANMISPSANVISHLLPAGLTTLAFFALGVGFYGKVAFQKMQTFKEKNIVK